jgi:predicted transcriptional regulator YheO
MIQEIWEMIQPNIVTMLVAILTGVASFIGTKIKKLYEEKVNDETKRKVVKTVVNAIEQLYQDLSGNEKLIEAQKNIVEMLNEKGITISELEMKMLIEEVCNSFKNSVKGDE